MPGAGRHWRKLLPLHPWAARRLRVEGYDLAVVAAASGAKQVLMVVDVTNPDMPVVRSVRDIAMLMDVLTDSGTNFRSVLPGSIAGLRVGYADAFRMSGRVSRCGWLA